MNVDHVATVRQARRGDLPDPLEAARAAVAAGADGITFHLREDRRHVQDHDAVALIREAGTVCNFELAAREEIVSLACELGPYAATLVPERREEVTTEGGLDLSRSDPALVGAIARLTGAGIKVSLFIDPDLATIERAASLGVPAVELHTGRYSHTWQSSAEALAALAAGAHHAAELGLAVHAGHGLDHANVGAVAMIPEIEELNIGHSIVARAMIMGIGQATGEMLRAMDRARR